MKITVMGPGCPNCVKAAEIVKQAVAEAGVEAEIEKITDFAEIAQRGVLTTPAVAVNGEVKCTGRVPDKAEVLGWIR